MVPEMPAILRSKPVHDALLRADHLTIFFLQNCPVHPFLKGTASLPAHVFYGRQGGTKKQDCPMSNGLVF